MSINQNFNKVIVPPIKIQGIKSKLIPFINSSIDWDSQNGIWIEPFLGSGSVLFNIQPSKAIVGDSNPHLIKFYTDLQNGTITPEMIRIFLTHEGEKLKISKGEYYYEVRERFNNSPNSLDFLFLNRSCFNGMIRFNRKGKFNVPFCKKPERFRQAYITKIVNQVEKIRKIIQSNDWKFINTDWGNIVLNANKNDFIYLDPPYIGRSTDYYNNWTVNEAMKMAEIIQKSPAGWALSMWKYNKYRCNNYINYWEAYEVSINHFYHLGSSEKNRNEVSEVLLIKHGYEQNNLKKNTKNLQLKFNI
ncbi:DNA adenine methylase [Staphylococcus coagulans]|uniref:DNA adenine methylase n=1 Tax=Staphylococcus coagulans TaxID=74706 RepID=UPI0028722820|nr:Dam family site-specific DNA-(adenine-N6)-methyltransferase [Staphylococcus coagulans]MDR9833586.1 Dam family site-specific DNA-(adenine-N6)-methyltransferase [Staphylococcus coagulans]